MKLCCTTASDIIKGRPGVWTIGVDPYILFCPFCGVKLPEKNIEKFEVIVRFNRGLGAEFKKIIVEAPSMSEARGKGEKEAGDQLAGSKFELLGSQATPIKPA